MDSPSCVFKVRPEGLFILHISFTLPPHGPILLIASKIFISLEEFFWNRLNFYSPPCPKRNRNPNTFISSSLLIIFPIRLDADTQNNVLMSFPLCNYFLTWEKHFWNDDSIHLHILLPRAKLLQQLFHSAYNSALPHCTGRLQSFSSIAAIRESFL